MARPSDRWALPPSCPASSAAWLQPLHLWGPEPLPLQVCARQALGELTGFQEEGREAALQGGCPRPTSLDFHLPMANAGLAHVPCASLHAGLSAHSVASEAQVCPQRDDKEPSGAPASS